MSPPSLITGLFLIDIGNSFGYPVGITAQLRAVSAISATIASLILVLLSIRFSQKRLLLLGLILYCISAIGCYIAPNFSILLVAYSIYGFGLPIVGTMTFTLVGTHIPLDKRARAIGVIVASMSLANIIGIPIIGIIAEFESWRLPFISFVLPFSFFGFIFAVKGIPSTKNIQMGITTDMYLDGIKNIINNRSALACFLGTGLFIAGRQAILTFSASMFRDRFHVSTSDTSFIYMAVGVGILLGSLSSGFFVDNYGRKLVTVITGLFGGIFTFIFMNTNILNFAIIFACLASFNSGMIFSASSSLVLEQIPRFRGSMMALNSAADNIGSTFGTGVGGLLLLISNYKILGVFLGLLSVISALVFHLIVQDPTKT